MHVDDRGHRALDSVVYSFIHTTRAAQLSIVPPFEAVRGAFHQSGEAAPLLGFHRSNSHHIKMPDLTLGAGRGLQRLSTGLVISEEAMDAELAPC